MLSLECQQFTRSQVSPFEAYNSLFSQDLMCISETYFDLSVLERDRGLQLNGYNLIRAYHSSNTKRGGVTFYYKEALCV